MEDIDAAVLAKQRWKLITQLSDFWVKLIKVENLGTAKTFLFKQLKLE